MFCRKCGIELTEETLFCPSCGILVAEDSSQPDHKEKQLLNSSALQTSIRPMKWFKFLIYFSLWLGVLVNFSSAVQLFTGAQYGDEYTALLVYSTYDGLKDVDWIVGFLHVVLAAFTIYTRYRLAGFHENGPKMLMFLYAANPVVEIIYHIGTSIVLPADVVGSPEYILGQIVGNGLVAVVMIVINRIYFKKRQHLFVYY